MKNSKLRKGFTTGTCAAAAAKAAAMAWCGRRSGSINVTLSLPEGDQVTLRSKVLEVGPQYALCAVVKDAGDDPDVTHGAEIIAKLKVPLPEDTGPVIIKGGRGVGIVTRPGLQVPPGEPAINPVPRRMITGAVRDVLGQRCVEVTIEVPEGERLAEKTFNPRLGILGGISIIGTKGVVEPMSLEAIKATVMCEIDVAVAEAPKRVYLAPGKIGERSLKKVFGDVTVVQTSNFIGEALAYLRHKGVERIVFGGHPGKLAKILMGYYDTHSEVSPQAAGFVAAYLGLRGSFNTVEEILTLYASLNRGFTSLAREIAEKIAKDFGFKEVWIYLFDMKSNLIAEAVWDG